MAEYKSFHYLMHKEQDAPAAHIVTGPKPLSFTELYSPREDPSQRLICRKEKSFWRTQDRVEFALFEDRKWGVLVATCRNVEKLDEVYRTIFLDLEKLYFEVEAKAQGNREPLTKKNSKKLNDDASLFKAVSDFVLSRLNIKVDRLPWPCFSPQLPEDTSSNDIVERMCTFDKMSSDTVDLEVSPPPYYQAKQNEIGNSILSELLQYLRAVPPNSKERVDGEEGINVEDSENTCTAEMPKKPDGNAAENSKVTPSEISSTKKSSVVPTNAADTVDPTKRKNEKESTNKAPNRRSNSKTSVSKLGSRLKSNKKISPS